MPSERVQRQIERLLDQAEEATTQRDWNAVLELVSGALALDAVNDDAISFKQMAEQALAASEANSVDGSPTKPQAAPLKPVEFDQASGDGAQPTSFASGRYTVSKFLGEGGKKRVYLAHDNTLDRDVAFALIKTEGLDETSRERVKREAQAMGRMGTHPCIMPIYDLGDESGRPFMVQPLMAGGDVEELVEDAEGPLELKRAIEIATQTAQGLSFAHSKGIVHRDLKPGNVWLDEDGSAKIGDFGLAVATDRSRLTVEKVMVGTVSYMPPEQATGGEVTPQADLYSLGAMLYEMCTGRVPFMGDDDIGIISQHINTPPVAPSWHNSQIPKTLDSLILRLLAKNPAERPIDADEVLAALEAVDLSAVEERDEESKGSLDAMAGGVFVGRHREMDQLKSIFEDVLSGRGRMVTLVGEPGIGKTRTAQELATYAGMRGAEVLWGRSYESGGAPPYWLWVQTIRSHVAATEADDLRRQLGATAPVISEIVSEVKAALPEVQPPPVIEDPESARFRLFDSISTFLKQVSTATPLVLMLEDLHWSDKPSLMLLEFVARELANSRILIVGNYRDMELNRRHPLSVTLGDLTRERLFERVVLRGLQRHDVERFIHIAAGISPPPALVDTVHSQTEGNPLFVTETVRLLIQEGDITSGQSSKGGTTSWEIRIPEGVREVIGRRLDRLSERCNEVLTTAAVVGRQFRFTVLLNLSDDVTENMLLDVIDEALEARAIEELPDEVGFYQFTHAVMQETLTGELSHTRSVRLHARIAEALEEFYGDQVEEHAAELVEHFAEAETVLGADKLVKYSLVAGLEALSAFAYEDAERLCRMALEVKRREDLTTAELFHVQGRAQVGIMSRAKMQTALDTLVRAFDLFLKLDRPEKAVVVASTSFPNIQGFSGRAELIDRAIGLVKPESREHAMLLAGKAMAARYELYDDELSTEAAYHAARIAKELGEPEIELRAWFVEASTRPGEATLGNNPEAFARARQLLEIVDDPVTEAMLYEQEAIQSMRAGRIEDSKNAIAHAASFAEKSRNQWLRAVITADSGAMELQSGNWSEAKRLLELALNYSPDDGRIISYFCRLLFEQGNFEQAMELLEGSDLNYKHRGLRVAGNAGLTIIYGFASEISGKDLLPVDIRESGEAFVFGRRRPQGFRRILSCGLASSMMLRADNAGLSRLLPILMEDWDPETVGFMSTAIPSVIPRAIATLGDNVTAFRMFRELGENQGLGVPDRAWLNCHWAETLIAHNSPGDHEKAIELQDEAISIATELGMKPLLERVLAKREILKA